MTTTTGRVRVWHDDEGWGVLDSESTPGGCWAHYSAVLVDGFRRLRTGHDVTFSFEAAEQDGFSFRAVEAWPSDRAPVRTTVEHPATSSALRSTVTLSFDSTDEAD